MNTRPFSPAGLALVLAVSLGGCATASSLQLPASPAFELMGGGHLRIVSGYVRNEPGAVVRGFVRRDPLWRGPIYGHLHITAFDVSGDVISRRATTWVGRFADSHGPPLAYQANLDVPRPDVSRITVAFAPGRHTASESFQ